MISLEGSTNSSRHHDDHDGRYSSLLLGKQESNGVPNYTININLLDYTVVCSG